jgi:hypothetical protein
MAEVQFALLAQSAQVSSDQLISMLGGGWDTVEAPEEAYPAGIVLTVVFRLAFEADEVGTHAGEVMVGHSNGEPLATVPFTVGVQRRDQELPPSGKITASLVIPVPVEFPGPGPYAVWITVGGASLHMIPLRMKVAGA